MFKYASLTRKGMELIAKATNLKRFVFTRMEYGNGVPDGFDASKSEDEIKAVLCERTALVSKKADIGMYQISVKNNCATLTGKIINSSLTESFSAKELGVYAKIDSEADVLVAYFVADDSPDPINQEALVGQEHKVIVDVAVGNASNVTIEYCPEIYASKGDFDALVAENEEEHGAMKQFVETETSERKSADSALQKSIKDLEASFDEKLGGIDISSQLNKTLQFDHVVDSDESLLAWANCSDGSMKSVRVKAGTYSLSGKMINLVSSGTKFVFAEDGAQINVSAYDRGIGATAGYGALVIGLSVKVENTTYSAGEIDGVFYRGMTCINCTGVGSGSGNIEGVFNQCSCIDCKSEATTAGTKADYYDCKGLVSFDEVDALKSSIDSLKSSSGSVPNFSFDESTGTLAITTK